MTESIHNDTKARMGKSLDVLRNELKKIRTGRASLSILDSIKVDCYGALTKIDQLATLSIPESRLITIQPWDSSLLKNVEKAIMKSGLGLTPSNDGKLIRIPIPPLTEDRRKELIKMVHKMCEEYKIAIRNIRRDSNEMLKNAKKNKKISEDEFFKLQDEIQKITDEYVTGVDEIEKVKMKDILEF